ncbi:MAG TPA: hypothetical protein VGK74_15845 [Symbiobacteriaceae bacterium]|jgi:hypothetical protein
MGGFLVNLFVRAADQPVVAEAVRQVLSSYHVGSHLEFIPGDDLAPAILISPSINGWVGVYDSIMESQSEELCIGVARALSERLETTALCFLVHGGSILMYWLAVYGEVADQFNSMPDYFGADLDEMELALLRGNPRILAEACGRPEARDLLARVLVEPGRSAFELIDDLAAPLGIENAAWGFNSLMEADTANELITRWAEFLTVTVGDLKVS